VQTLPSPPVPPQSPGHQSPGHPAAPPVPPPAPRARAAPSPLGRLTVSAALLAVGLLAAVDLAGSEVPGTAYLALPLAIVGLGLVVGAWFGRARALIAVGAVLGVAVAVGVAIENADDDRPVTWQVTTVDQLERTYDVALGDTTLDLSALDLSGRDEAVDVHVSVGSLRVVLPARVDVRVSAQVDLGDSRVLGQRWSGIGQGRHSVTDTGVDGPGGGRLSIVATVGIGDLEVVR